MLRFDSSPSINSLTTLNRLIDTDNMKERLSVVDLARAKIQESISVDLEETSSDIGIALGGRLAKDRKTDRSLSDKERTIKVLKMVTEIGHVLPTESVELEDESNRWMFDPNAMAALLQQHPDVGQAALRVGMLLARRKLSKRMRKKLQGMLGFLIEDDESIGIAVFAAVEFGATNERIKRDMRQLYAYITETPTLLSEWFVMLGDPESRDRKLRAMIQVVSFELSISGTPIMGSHLAGVIQDLRQLQNILSVTTECERAVQQINIPGVMPDHILLSLVRALEEPWLDNNILPDLLPSILPTNVYPFVDQLYKVAQHLPDVCFRDKEHRDQVKEALFVFRESRIED